MKRCKFNPPLLKKVEVSPLAESQESLPVTHTVLSYCEDTDTTHTAERTKNGSSRVNPTPAAHPADKNENDSSCTNPTPTGNITSARAPLSLSTKEERKCTYSMFLHMGPSTTKQTYECNNARSSATVNGVYDYILTPSEQLAQTKQSTARDQGQVSL